MLDPSRYWYRHSLHLSSAILLPFSLLFFICITVRRWLYRIGIFKTYHFTVPIVVIGNITVGGTGKTPFVIWLAAFLRQHGYHPGIVSRGYGGKKQLIPCVIRSNSKPDEVGDEAIVLARETDCPVVVGVDRVAAVREVLKQPLVNIVISDDGLQHYRLGRDLEITVIDSERQFGNRQLLPTGPLREPISRLKTVDLVFINKGLMPGKLISIMSQQTIDLAQLAGRQVHAIAGIGHPERFFACLKQAGLQLITHVFPDHYFYSLNDFDFKDAYPVIMTEKDAVKCESFADKRYWYLSATANVDLDFQQKLLVKLGELK